MVVLVTQRLTRSVKHVWNLQPHHAHKNKFEPPVRDIFRRRGVEMGFGTNPERILSTNIWLTRFHCIAILSFPLTVFNFLFVTYNPFQGRSCVPHPLQQYHLGVVSRPGQPSLQPSQLLEGRTKICFITKWHESCRSLACFGINSLALMSCIYAASISLSGSCSSEVWLVDLSFLLPWLQSLCSWLFHSQFHLCWHKK